jgi:hypothetical protein
MTKIVLEIENQLDLEPILAIVTNVSDYDETILSETEHKYRKEGLAKFGGILKSKQGYNPSKSEFYEV